MRGFVNYLLGTVRVTVEGAFPERIINLCAQREIEFWAVEWLDETCISLTIRRKGLASLRRLVERLNYQIRIVEARGLGELLSTFRQRYAFLIGLAMILSMVSVLSQFILTIELTGNQIVSDSLILQQLQLRGVRPGSFGPALDRRQIEQEILLAMPELSWVTINLHGTRAQVQVREVQRAPERIDEIEYAHVISRAGGIVTHVEAEQGDALVKEGDIVAPGEILISGTVTLEPPIYSDQPERYYYVHARGRVWARTWRSMTAVMPLEARVKTYTGERYTCLAAKIFEKRVEFFGKSSIYADNYAKITSVRQVVLPGGMAIPIWWLQETYLRYETSVQNMERDAAADLLKDMLDERLRRVIGARGRVIRVEYETQIADGMIQVIASGECLEEIGVETSAHMES